MPSNGIRNRTPYVFIQSRTGWLSTPTDVSRSSGPARAVGGRPRTRATTRSSSSRAAVSTSGSTTIASTPCVQPRLKPSDRSRLMNIVTASTSGALAAKMPAGTAIAAVPFRRRVSAIVAPTRVWASGSMAGAGYPAAGAGPGWSVFGAAPSRWR